MKKTQLVIVGFEDGGKKLGAKENGYTLEAGKVWGKKEKKGKKKKRRFSLRTFRKECNHADT